jgi:hypothetical protein
MKKRTLLTGAVAVTALAAAGLATYRKSTVEITSVERMLTLLDSLKSRQLPPKAAGRRTRCLCIWRRAYSIR